MEQILQIIGASGTIPDPHTDSRAYLLLNLVGAAVLAVLALREQQLDFLLLEAVWSDCLGAGPGAQGGSGLAAHTEAWPSGATARLSMARRERRVSPDAREAGRYSRTFGDSSGPAR